MDTKEQAQDISASAPSGSRRLHLPSMALLVAGLAFGGAALVVYCGSGPDPVPKKEPKGPAWSYEEVFPSWPKDRKPEFVIVITGQTYGYLQKCGCSDPQKGGLERRFNFIQGFKDQQIEVIPIDLGDVTSEVSEHSEILHSQALLKYQIAMRTMKAMGYRVVGLGKEEFAIGLHEATSEFSLQPGNELPRLLGANLSGYRVGQAMIPKAAAFPTAEMNGSIIHDWDILATNKKVNLGVVGIVGDPLIADVKKIDPKIVFAPNSAKIVDESLKTMNKQPNKPDLNVLLYSGPFDLAKKAAEIFPQFRIVVCRSEEAEPPAMPVVLTNPKMPQLNTMLIRVGHKGQNVGVVGVFKDAKGGLELMYQKVSMTPELDSVEGKEKQNIALQELERYSKLVRDRGFLTMNRKSPHALQTSNPKAAFAGSDKCMSCHNGHDNSWATWNGSKHAQAYKALETIAKRPSLRHFDGECIRCHTVGYDFNTGFVSAKATPALMNVGCENCHGPGSEHVANPLNKAFALELSPWKVNGVGNMPDVDKLKAYQEERDQAKKQLILNQQQLQTMLRVDRICQTCHNAENDPHFKIETFWPQIVHAVKPVAKKVEVKKDDGTDVKSTGPALKLPNP